MLVCIPDDGGQPQKHVGVNRYNVFVFVCVSFWVYKNCFIFTSK
jgi:hypothetical protein